MYKFRRYVAALTVTAAFVIPIIASAETGGSLGLSADVQVQVQALLGQIKALQEQIKMLVASSTGGQSWGMGSTTGGWMAPGQMGKMACITLNRNVRQGDQGDDVKNLQQLLSDEGEFHGNITGFFGPITAKAMMMFQMHQGIASSTDGTVGPLTRGFFERRCGKGMGMNGQNGPGMQNKMFGGIKGTISANNTTNIIVQTDGGNTAVIISASTTIKVFNGTSTPPTAGSVSDLVVGKNVVAAGPKNADGSIQAIMIGVGDLPMLKGPGGQVNFDTKDIQGMIPGVMDMVQQFMGGMNWDDHGGPGEPHGMMPIQGGPPQPGNGYPQNW